MTVFLLWEDRAWKGELPELVDVFATREAAIAHARSLVDEPDEDYEDTYYIEPKEPRS